MPFTPVAGMTLACTAAARARADACGEAVLLDAQLGLAYAPAGCTEISFTAPAISGKL